ncbi:MAG: type I DNA topoisomerase [Chloroflexi bacterium]|nr:type I DNA topoisomerase [Chloroflexota bacterium]
MPKDLVIVESPAKARTVGRYLGDRYEVKASMGHVRDLPERDLGVDIDANFKPTYVEVSGRENVMREIKRAAKGADSIYLATDPDREGEAISWHLVQAAGLKGAPLRRVVFHEITENAIREAFQHPREIDMRLVNAQQARRILDRIVGYELSPVLWKKVRRGLSAGRVQSVALRLIVDREREIEAFKPEEYWVITVTLAKEAVGNQTFRAVLSAIAGKSGKARVANREEADRILADLRASRYRVSSVVTKEVKTRPAAPFITSTLQQEAARRLRYSAQRTMRIAQDLYEGVQLGGGEPVGLITYMRTDSTNLSPQAVTEIGEFIKGKFGPEYFDRHRVYKTKSKVAQEAHEAIRPTSVQRTPESVAPFLSQDQLRVYELVWKRAVACQMKDSVADATTVDVEAAGGPSQAAYTLRAIGSVLKFAGFRIVYLESREDEDESDEDSRELVPLREGELVRLMKAEDAVGEQKFTQPPPRYSEAMLIRTLEENGIGRPSTFATIVQTIEQRDYVARLSGRFKPTKLGIVVCDYLKERFPEIMDTGFTSTMEENLDSIARGEVEWIPTLKQFHEPFKDDLQKALSGPRVPSAELDEKSEEICEKCERPMVIKTGRFGKFLSCSGFPACRNSRPLRITTGATCPVDGGEILQQQGRRRQGKPARPFYGCSNYPNCTFTTTRKPIKEPCPECGKLLVERGRDSVQCVICKYTGPRPGAAVAGDGKAEEEAVATAEA